MNPTLLRAARFAILLGVLALAPMAVLQAQSASGFGADVSLGFTLRNDGVGGSFSALFPIGGRWRVGLQGLFYEHRFDGNFRRFTDFAPASVQPLYLLPTVSYTFIRRERWQLYAGVIPLGLRINTSAPVNESRRVLGLALGAEYNLNRRWFLQAQATGLLENEYLGINQNRLIYSGAFISGTIGVGYRIGKRYK